MEDRTWLERRSTTPFPQLGGRQREVRAVQDTVTAAGKPRGITLDAHRTHWLGAGAEHR